MTNASRLRRDAMERSYSATPSVSILIHPRDRTRNEMLGAITYPGQRYARLGRLKRPLEVKCA